MLNEIRRATAAALAMTALGATAGADWAVMGGNAQRNGQATSAGPTDATLAWENDDDFSLIAWHPYLSDGRVFVVRESGFPSVGGPANDAIVCLDLATGTELWNVTLPYGGDPNEEWIAWIGGVANGLVYASRSDNSKNLPFYSLDVNTGAIQWQSEISLRTFAYDGFVFTPDGDIIVGDLDTIARVDGATGATEWDTDRSCPVSGRCGGGLGPDGVFIDQAAPGGNVITKIDLATGEELYDSPIMVGFTVQNSPFVSPDGGTVYLSRTQNNVFTDFLYAFEDTGAALVEKWHVPVRWTTSHEAGIGADGSVYTFLDNNEFVRLDPADGTVIDTAGVLPIADGNLSAKTAIGTDGTVYLSNGWANNPPTNGRLWAFPADLSQTYFTLTLDRQNQGGPALSDGTLVVADRQAVYAYRAEDTTCIGDLDESGAVDAADLALLLAAWGRAGATDLDRSGVTDAGDLAILLAAWGDCE